MSTTNTGRNAELAVAEHLQAQGYKILGQNWRTRWCEIDVIAKRDDVVWFVEVKYRRTSRQGDGLDYITSKKLQQMQFAAELWVSSHDWRGDYELIAAAVAGDDFFVSDVVVL